jgi:hypothetical protein
MVRLIVFLGIIGICTISPAAYSQKKDKGDDVYGIPASPKDTVNHHQTLIDDLNFIIDDFVKGYVLLPSGVKLNGLVRFNGVTAIYKDTIADKTTRYDPKEIMEFVAAADTFRVLTDTTIVPPNPHMASFGDKLFISKVFVKEMVYGAKLCLYKQTLFSNTAPMTMMMPVGVGRNMVMRQMPGSIRKSMSKNNFFIKRPGENRYIIIPENNKEFKKVLAKYFKDSNKLAEDIKADKLVYEDIEEIVNQYNKKS